MEELFEVVTPLGCRVRVGRDYWDYVVSKKHPYMRDREGLVEEALRGPDEIRKSKTDQGIFLYYIRKDRLYCAVARHEDDGRGFLITAYPADKLKEGEVIWTK